MLVWLAEHLGKYYSVAQADRLFRLWRGAGGIAGRKLAPLLQSELAVRR